MKRLLIIVSTFLLFACNNATTQPTAIDASKALDSIFYHYWKERMQLFPMEATGNGDNRYNDKYTITISNSFRDSLGKFYTKYLSQCAQIDSSKLTEVQLLSYRIFRYEMETSIEGLKYPTHLMPISQFWSPTLELPQLGSGTGNQPFKTVADYDNWLKRLRVFPAWVDTAIVNMRQGIATKWVLPNKLVVKILPQLHEIIKKDSNSIFYGPIKTFPAEIGDAERKRLQADYLLAIDSIVNPSYQKLEKFFTNEYLPASRASSGIGALPGGTEYYHYCIRYWTTTQLTADSIYNIGLSEVAKITAEMNRIKDEIGFQGNLNGIFKHIETEKKFFPFTTAQQVLDSFWAIKKIEDPQLKKMFNKVPKTQFTIRQTEAFRAASASAEYNQGSADGSRPGIFYVPILDPKKFNAAGMTTLFLHEAIPGHHYQISLQQENTQLPAFRRFLWYGAYGEGWAHYCETLGKGLGLYNDPYQYMGHLGDAMHRAIRLVVDAGLHSKNMTREEAIGYMMLHEQITEHDATAEIERYMAIPGQALSYKIGQMAISSEKQYYTEKKGDKFDIASFHDEVLKDGCVPLQLLHEKLQTWGNN